MKLKNRSNSYISCWIGPHRDVKKCRSYIRTLIDYAQVSHLAIIRSGCYLVHGLKSPFGIEGWDL